MKVLCVVIGFNHRFGRYLAIKGGSFQGVAFTIAIIYLLLLNLLNRIVPDGQCTQDLIYIYDLPLNRWYCLDSLKYLLKYYREVILNIDVLAIFLNTFKCVAQYCRLTILATHFLREHQSAHFIAVERTYSADNINEMMLDHIN